MAPARAWLAALLLASLATCASSVPTDGQVFECFAGWTCSVGPVNGTLVVGSRLRVMESCATAGATTGFVAGAGTFAGLSTGLLSSGGDPAISQALASVDSPTYNFGSAIVIGPGHRYELCYCAANCGTSANFAARVGYLDVPGPSAKVAVLCSAGRRCDFALSHGDEGMDLADGDVIAVLQACAVDSMHTPGKVAGWHADGISDSATGGGRYFAWNASLGGAIGLAGAQLADEANGVGPFLTVSPGSYRLCWCHRRMDCSDTKNFRLDIGGLDFAGPSGGQAWECIRGRSCSVHAILGSALAGDDRYAVLENCAEEPFTLGFYGGQVINSAVSPDRSVSGGISASFQWSTFNASAGMYKLCWAPAWQPTSAQNCASLGWSTDEGSPYVCAAPAAEAGAVVCPSLAAPNAAAVCAGLGARLCLPHELRQGVAEATECAGAADAWSARHCGSGFRVVTGAGADPNSAVCLSETVTVNAFTTSPQTRPGICCADVEARAGFSGPEQLGEESAYRVSAGQLVVRGPFAQDLYCVLNDTCVVQLDGVKLNASVDFVQVVPNGEACEQLPSTDFDMPRTSASAGSVASQPSFKLGLARKFGAFELCWCTATAGGDCTRSSGFNVHVGALLIGGMTQQTVFCVYSLVCAFELSGTNLGESDALVVVAGGSATLCGNGAAVVAEVAINPTNATGMVSSSARSFDIGAVLLHASFRLCYCIHFRSRRCYRDDDGSPILENFNMKAGTLEIRGPYLGVELPAARAGAPYILTLKGRLLMRMNRIAIIDSSGPACGEPGSNVSSTSVYMPFPGPGSILGAGESEVWYDVQIFRAGEYNVCWCLGELTGDGCLSASDFGILVGNLTVYGLLEDRPAYFANQIVGNPFALEIEGFGLRATDRVVLMLATSGDERCGSVSTALYGSLSQGASRPPSVTDDGNTTVQVWPRVTVFQVGRYLVCWCGRALCSQGEHFNIEAGAVNVTGPELAQFPSAVAGEPFELVLRGSALGPADRISIVQIGELDDGSGIQCGTPEASILSDTVEPLADERNLTMLAGGRYVAADALGAPSSCADDGSEQVWNGLQIRWRGRYRICWGGDHGSAFRCVREDGNGACMENDGVHHPYHVGDILVVDAPVTLVGTTEIARCDPLDVIAQPSDGAAADAVASYARWTCEPPRGEVCATLRTDFLDSEAIDQLRVRIPGDLVAGALDRARIVAMGLGTAWELETVILSVSLVDAHNITRSGSMVVRIHSGEPILLGVPATTRLRRDVDALRLNVFVSLPGDEACDHPTIEPGSLQVAWRLADAPFQSLSGFSTASRPTDLSIPASGLAFLGTTLHNIVATVTFADGAFPPRDVYFQVVVADAPGPSASIATPALLPPGCPLVLDASASSDPLRPAGRLSFEWACSGLEDTVCSGTEASAPVRVWSAADAALVQSIVVNVLSEDGRSSAALAAVLPDRNVSADDTVPWPVALAPLPSIVGAGSSVRCAAVAPKVGGAVPAICGHPADAVWWLEALSTGTATELEVRRADTGTGGAAVSLVALVPAPLLAAGGRYRCVLRASGLDVHPTAEFQVAAPPSGGRLAVVPSTGVALTTKFTLSSYSWASEQLPLEHSFVAHLNGTDVSVARLLRGYSAVAELGCVWGVAGRVRFVARVRDVLGSISEAVQEASVTKPGKEALAVAAAAASDGSLLAKLAAWPPGPREYTAAAAALLDFLSVGDAAVKDDTAAEIAASILPELWSGVEASDIVGLGREDIALRAHVLEASLRMAAQRGLAPREALAAACALELSAMQSKEASALAEKEPIDAGTARDFLASMSALTLSENFSIGVTGELRERLRAADYYVGAALNVQLRREAAIAAAAAADAPTSVGIASSNMSVVVGRAARDGTAHTLGGTLLLSLPLVRRRLAGGTLAACNAAEAEVQLSLWPGSPVGAEPLAEQVAYGGVFDGWRVATEAEAGLRRPMFAGIRLLDCLGGLAAPAAASVDFIVSGGLDRMTFEVGEEQDGNLHTYAVNLTWVCAQWDAFLGQWRVDASAIMEGAGGSLRCAAFFNSIDAAGAGPSDNGTILLAAVPSARRQLLRVESLITVTKPPGPLFRGVRMTWMLITALVVQVGLLFFCAFSRKRPRRNEEICEPREDGRSSAGAAPFKRDYSVHPGDVNTKCFADPAKPAGPVKSVAIGHSYSNMLAMRTGASDFLTVTTKSLRRISSRRPRATGERVCVCIPAVRLFDGLWLLAPLKMFTWCCARRQRKVSGGHALKRSFTQDVRSWLGGDQSADNAAAMVHSALDAPLKGAHSAIETCRPPLRSQVKAAVCELFERLEDDRKERASVVTLLPEHRCGGRLLIDRRVAHARSVVWRSLKFYRRLVLAGDEFNRLRKRIKNGEFAASVIRPVRADHKDDMRATDSARSEARMVREEAFNLRVAHHIQLMLLCSAVDRDISDVQLTQEERESLHYCQEALRVELQAGAEHQELALSLATANAISPQPFFAPCCAVRMTLTNVTLGEAPKWLLRELEHEAPPSLEPPSKRKPALALADTDDFAGVLPGPSRQNLQRAKDEEKKRAEIVSSQYLLGCAYYLWANEDRLFLQRAETVLRDPVAVPHDADHAVSCHEPAVGFRLDQDIETLLVPRGDDRMVYLNIRGGLYLRFRGQGEVRAWIDALTHKSLRGDVADDDGLAHALPRPELTAVVSGVDQPVKEVEITDVLFGYTPIGGSQQPNAPSFLYQLEGAPPHSASNAWLQTVSKDVVPASIWYSHGGTVLSIALSRPGRVACDALMDQAPSPPGAVDLHGEAAVGGASGVADAPTALGLYVSGVKAYEYAVLSDEDVASRRFCMVVAFVGGVKIRFCFASRYERIVCQASIAHLRACVHPESDDAPVVTPRGPRRKPKLFRRDRPPGETQTTQGSAYTTSTDASAMQDTGSWNGLFGTLELTILSASDLGVAHDDQIANQALVMFGGKLSTPKAGNKFKNRTGLPSPQVVVWVPSQAPPNKEDCRRTPTTTLRTADPVWNCSWYYTVEYSANDPPPSDIRLEVWDVAGQLREYLGELSVPFPRQPGHWQYQARLRCNRNKMSDPMGQLMGSISLQLHWKSEHLADICEIPRLLAVDPSMSTSVCGKFGISCIRAQGLRVADILSSDPYCVIRLGFAPKQTHTSKTSAQMGTTTPSWYELHECFINWPKNKIDAGAVVNIEFWDFDRSSSHEFLGEVSFPLPLESGDQVLEMPMQANRNKGAGLATGTVQVRMFFREEFQRAIDTEPELTPYEQTFCRYFGGRAVDEQLARIIAPQLAHFHLSAGRILRGQLRWAFHFATCGLTDPGPAFPRGFRVRGYLSLTSWLWSSLAFGSLLLLCFEQSAKAGFGAGLLVALFAPSPAHILTGLFWYDPEDKAKSLLEPPRPGASPEKRKPPRGHGVPEPLSVAVIGVSIVELVLFIGYTGNDESVNLHLTVTAVTLLIVRLLVWPIASALAWTFIVVASKRSPAFDWLLWFFPSALCAHDVVL